MEAMKRDERVQIRKVGSREARILHLGLVLLVGQNFHFNLFFFFAMEEEHEWACNEPG